MVRSVILRSFDRQMASLIEENLSDRGVNFVYESLPVKIEKNSSDLTVTFENIKTKNFEKENFDSVLFAIGRKVGTLELNLEAIGIKTEEETGKIITINEQTNIPHIYAVGDVLYGKPELSPVAIEAGKLLARRILGKSEDVMNYENVATTVFSPLEYGCVGLSEENAIQKFGDDEIEVITKIFSWVGSIIWKTVILQFFQVYHAYYKPTEFFIPQKSVAQCYLKVITLRKHPKKVLGMHIVGPAAGEVIQGYAAAMKWVQKIWEVIKKWMGKAQTI